MGEDSEYFQLHEEGTTKYVTYTDHLADKESAVEQAVAAERERILDVLFRHVEAGGFVQLHVIRAIKQEGGTDSE